MLIMGAKIVLNSREEVAARLNHALKKREHALIEFERVRSNKNYWQRIIRQLETKLVHFDLGGPPQMEFHLGDSDEQHSEENKEATARLFPRPE